MSLQELEGLRGTIGLKVERDLHFTASKALADYATEARFGPVQGWSPRLIMHRLPIV